jgi:hypothetical protein
MTKQSHPFNGPALGSHSHGIYDPGHSHQLPDPYGISHDYVSRMTRTPVEQYMRMRQDLADLHKERDEQIEYYEERIKGYEQDIATYRALLSDEQQQEAMIEILKENDE